ncbi:hypothetical protein ADENT20671_2288 [Actinomyces denticolens]|nr:hypothetical protein ADENT20671_2288 [Actinomyces denticolens]
MLGEHLRLGALAGDGASGADEQVPGAQGGDGGPGASPVGATRGRPGIGVPEDDDDPPAAPALPTRLARPAHGSRFMTGPPLSHGTIL